MKRSDQASRGALQKKIAALAAVLAAVLALRGPASGIVITEIHYAPAGAAGEKERLKFIEIFNEDSTTVDLTGYQFAEGVSFDFPPGLLLPARTYLVVCADASLVKALYGIQNAIGDFAGNLNQDGERLVLLNEGGGIAAKLEYQNRGRWPSIPAGTGYTLSLLDPYLATDVPENWTSSGRPGGTPGKVNFPPPHVVEAEVFGEVSPWSYRKGWDGAAMAPFSDPPDAWKGRDFDDSGWAQGDTGIGYGDADDRTVLDDMKMNYISFAARKRFTLAPEVQAEMETLVLRLRVDDGYAAYLNGEEIGRIYVGNDLQVPFDLPATGIREVTFAAILRTVPKEKVLPGENVLAVEVHNRRIDDTDASLIPSLLWRKTVYAETGSKVPVRLNEVMREPESGSERWLELYNPDDSDREMGGFSLTDDPARADRYVFPAGKKVPRRGFLSLSEGEIGIALAGSGSRRELRLFLYEPDHATVVDAVVLEMRSRTAVSPLSQARIPDGGPSWIVSTTPTREGLNSAPLERDIVVNEIMYHPMVGPEAALPDGRTLEKGEFIEILNRGDRTISLENWAFTQGYNYVFPAGVSLAPRSYLVLAPDVETILQTYSLQPGEVLGPEPIPEAQAAFGILSNSGERIRLEDPLGNPVEEVRYHEDGEWPSLADGGGSSLELIDPWQDNAIPSAWAASDETSKAPWTQYSSTAMNVVLLDSEFWVLLVEEGECLIDEISVKKNDVEYVPNGGFETSTSPWRITGTHIRSHRTTAEAHAGSACLHLIATGGGDNRVNHVEVDTASPMPGGPLTVSFWARWLSGGQLLLTSGNNGTNAIPLAMSHLLSVPADLGTPGRENSVRTRLLEETGSDDLGPVIGEVRHVPAVPRAADPVTVLARISDSGGVKEAFVEYRVGQKAAAPSTSPMYDDGQHKDGEAGDGLFAGTIPPSVLGTKILFDIAAQDAGDRWRRFPVDAPDRTLLYQVSDPYQAPGLRSRLVLDEDNKSTLETRLLHSDDPVVGSFVFEEAESFYNVGVRYHGSPWNRPPDPKMFSLRFRGDKPLRGYTRINASRYGSTPNEGTAYQLIRLASGGQAARTVYSPRYNYMRFYYNGQPHAILAEIIPPSGDYFRTMFPEDGDGYAYKLTGKLEFNDYGNFTFPSSPPWTQLRTYGPTKESYRYYYNPSTREGEDNFDPLIRLLTILDPGRTLLKDFEDPLRGIEAILNVESTLRVLAIRALQDDWDTVGIGNGQNAFLYFAPREGRFYLVPWDMDHTFDLNHVSSAPMLPSDLNSDPSVRRMVNDSAKYRRTYLRLLKEFTTTFWTVQGMDPWFTSVVADLKGLMGAPEGIKSFMSSRLNILKNRFPQLYQAVAFAITFPPPGGKDFAVKASEATVGGTAPYEVEKIYVEPAGGALEEASPTWTGTATTEWRLKLPLKRGKNPFRFWGFNVRGEPVGNGLSIDIYDATEWTAPAISRIDPGEGSLAGGTAVTIAGDGFQDGIAVTFGARPAQEIERISLTELQAVAPAATAPGPVDVRATNLDGQSAEVPGGFTYTPPGAMFIRSDMDASGVIDITDVLAMLDYLYRQWPAPCAKAGDLDDNGLIEITDPIYLIQFLYLAGEEPKPPFPDPGYDPTDDPLGCE